MSSSSYFKPFTCAVLMFMGCLVGCSHPAPVVRGAPPARAPSTTVAQLARASAKQVVTLRGEMTDKCPIAGCWFMLRDRTGVARIDTKAAGFVVSDVPLHTIVTVTGKVVPGTEPGLAATGIRY